MRTIVLATTLGLTLSATAGVINPVSNTPDAAVVLLEGVEGNCTGSVVGLNPVTVITAKHCIAASAAYLDLTPPKTIVMRKFKDEVFSAFEGVLPGDIAVLIYEEPQSRFASIKDLTKTDLFVLNAAPLVSGQKFEFCGFGGHRPVLPDYSSGTFHCGANRLILEDPSLNRSTEFPEDASDKLGTYPVEQQVQILNSMVQDGLDDYGTGTRIGFANFPGESASLVQTGDSGGPMFIRDEEGRKHLIAVSSAGGAAVYDGALRPVMGLGWRIDSEWTKEVLQEARSKGADL